MLIVLIIIFIICYVFCFTKWWFPLTISVFILTIVFLYEIFGAYFISSGHKLNINGWLLFFGLLYFYFWFYTFLYLSRFGLSGIVAHSLIMVSISIFKITLPLHPFILLYPHIERFLPTTENTIINLFLLFFLSGVLFNKCSLGFRITCLCVAISFFIATNTQIKESEKKDINIAIIQVGLYFEKGGSTNNFFSDLKMFLNQHPEVDIIAFSENNFFSYKSEYNQEMSEKLLSDIKGNNFDDKYHLFLSFSGYKDFNNIITLYKFAGVSKINQKMTLIPFIEKPGLFNTINPPSSEFYTVDKSHRNSMLKVMGNSVSTYICYDVFFPDVYNNIGDIVLIQSNYKLLDYGDGFEHLQRIATYLAKFIKGLRSKIVINIQNTGGTVVISNDWRIDNEIYEISKKEPFFVIDTSKL